MKALVTGGGGFLGLAIVRRLVESGAQVKSLSRNSHGELKSLGVEQIAGDVSDHAVVSSAVRGCDVVFHVAAKAGIWGAYEEYHRVNVRGTENVIAACREHGVARLVHTSSPSVVFDGKDMEGVDESVPCPKHFEAHYPRTKAEAEQQVLAANDRNLATVALRPHLIWGPGDNHLLPRLVARSRAGQLRKIGSATKKIDTVYVTNAADAHLLAAERLVSGSEVCGKAYFITNGEPAPTWDMVNKLLRAAGAPEVEKRVPVGVAMAAAWCFETAHRVLGLDGEPRLTRFVVKELSTSHWFSIERANRELGYRPRISIEEGLRMLGKDVRSLESEQLGK